MSATKWALVNNTTGLAVVTTELNSLANGTYAISSVVNSGIYDNTGNLDLFADFCLELAYTTSAPAAGTKVAELYLLPAIDGTNYPSVDGSNVPQKALLVATFETRLPSTSTQDFMVATGIPIPPRKFKFVIHNTSGQTLKSSGNQLVIAPFQIQNS